MASVSGALRPCVLPRGAFRSVPRCSGGRYRSITRALLSVVHERPSLGASAKWNHPCQLSAASLPTGSRIEQALLLGTADIKQELLRSRHFSKSFSIKAIAGDTQTSVIESDVVMKEEEVGRQPEEPEDVDNPPNWTIKLLYDGDCPLCMKEVDFLRERNKTYSTIRLVDINSDSYSPEENAGVGYEEAMGRIHGVLRDGTILTGISVFRKVYQEVGLGWVYAITSVEPIGKLADAVYDLWAKYRLPMTGRPPLVEVLEARRQKKAMADECNTDTCRVNLD